MREEIREQVIIPLNLKKTFMKRLTLWEKSFLLAIFILVFLGWGLGAQAQEFPARPITLLISMRPGAGVDVGSRMIAKEGTKILGQEIIPVNKAGGGGAVAAGILANSKGDGYTLLGLTSGTLTNIPHLESVAYDPIKDFIPIIQYGSLISTILVRSDSPHKSFKDFIDFARKNPGRVSYGYPGVGTSPHLAMEHVILEEKANIAMVPFEGSTPGMTALLGGHVSACGTSTSGCMAHLKAGKVKVLATTGEKRIEVLPDVPTLHELGYPYGVLLEMYLIMAPKGTPPAVIKTLEGAFRKAMETPEFRTLADNFYMYVENPLSGQKFKEYIENEYTKNGEIIRKAKIGK